MAIHLWAAFAVHVLSIANPSPWAPHPFRPYYARYDTGWYARIAREGYGPPPPAGVESPHAFFPLYPMLGRAVHRATGLDPVWSLTLISWAAWLFALPLFCEECRRRLGEERASGPLPFLLLYPVAFFFAAAYTESLFLLLLLLAFRFVRTGRFLLAVVVAVLLGLTRAPAAAVGPALALAAWENSGRGRRAWLAVLAVAPLAGVLTHAFGIGWQTGEPGVFFRSMGAWAHRSTHPAGGLFSFVKEQITLFSSGRLLVHPGAIGPLAHWTLFAALAVVQVRRRRWSDAAFTAGVLGLAALTGTTNGVPRYTLTIFPGFVLLFELLEGRRRLRIAVLAASAALLLVRAALFVNWHFVS